jgi:hypothetical protein
VLALLALCRIHDRLPRMIIALPLSQARRDLDSCRYYCSGSSFSVDRVRWERAQMRLEARDIVV